MKQKIKEIIDKWYYEDLDQAITIGEIKRIILAKKIIKYINSQSFTGENK